MTGISVVVLTACAALFTLSVRFSHVRVHAGKYAGGGMAKPFLFMGAALFSIGLVLI